MNLSELIKQRLEELEKEEVLVTDKALARAEQLADIYSNVKVVPYRVPVERFIGMTFNKADENEVVF